jgi:AbrB family looped-hinge helix DNA binding protein
MKEFESRMTQKDQVTIPAEIRRQLGLKLKETVQIVQEADGIKVRARKSTSLEGFGSVQERARSGRLARSVSARLHGASPLPGVGARRHP